jgi:spore maturation protein CgeB
MVESGLSPSVRLFEAAACGTTIISDYWDGLETLFEPDKEILIARSTDDVQRYLSDINDEQRDHIGRRARKRVLDEHSSRERARQLMEYVEELQSVSA